MITCGSKEIPGYDQNTTNQKIRQIQNGYRYLPPTFHAYPRVRLAIIVTLTIGVTLAVLASQGGFSRPISLNVNWSHIGLGLAGFTVLTIGAICVIRRVKTVHYGITEQGIGKLTGDDHWQEVFYWPGHHPGYVDTSTLNEARTGKAFYYGYKSFDEHYVVSSLIIATAFLHAIATVAYNIVRIVWIPLYILGCMAIEKNRGKPLFNRYFRVEDIPKQMWASVRRICKSPFYAMAQIYAALYSYIDPLNGRKLGHYIEWDGNEGVTRAEGFWSVQGPQSLWHFEGGGSPDGLGRNGFYAAGCWTPFAVVYYENGEIIEAKSLSRELDARAGSTYSIYTPQLLEDDRDRILEESADGS